MKAAGLKAIDTVVSSTAILVKSKHPSNPAMVDLIAARIKGVISKSPFALPLLPSPASNAPLLAAQKYVLCQYNIERSSLHHARNITPGRRAPTISALEAEGWVAVSAMVEKKHIATVMDKLTEVGATDILVLEIVNTRAP